MTAIPEDIDEQLSAIIDRLLGEVRSGKEPPLREVCEEYPHLAGELRGLWATARMAESFSIFEEDPVLSDLVALPMGRPRTIGPFEILEELGRGGMGVVYKARQVSLDRTVALKMILRGDFASDQDQVRFRQEAEAAARIEHPNIVPIYESGQIDGRPYFIMRYIEGETLSKRLSHGPLAPREAAELILAVAQAIAEAHRRGVLHRDLKPANILLDLDGKPHVTDFGLAKRTGEIGSLTQSGLVLGTPSYMAPEQAGFDRGVISAATDVYSLGAILYQMLTGRPPFQAATPLDTVMMLLEHEPVPPRLFNRAADPDLEQIAMKCLQKHPDLRYPSAGELADDLKRYLAREPLSIRMGGIMPIIHRMLRETHHAPLLENWGLLWMWNGAVLLAICLLTNGMQFRGVHSFWPYLVIWSFGLGTWATIFWQLRRRAGPIQFVERQVAHVWAASVICAPLMYFLELMMGLPVLTLSPILALIGGTVFLVKASILTGEFYLQALAHFVVAFLMALWPQVGLTLFGLVAFASFFIPGLKYYRQRKRLAAR